MNFLSQIVFGTLVVLGFGALNAQNLVPNPSFEDYFTCPTSNAQLNVVTSWGCPNQGSPDYFNACSTSNYADVPVNFFGTQNARTGDAYVQCVFFPSIGANFREYVQVQLISPLVAGQSYDVSFYVSLADNSAVACNNIGLYLSTLPVSSTLSTNLTFMPQILESSIITDVNNWTLIGGTYTAAGGEEYITIGNFFNDATTNTAINPVGNSIYATFYYIDDVCVSLVGGSGCIPPVLPVELLSFSANHEGGRVKTNWSTFSEINNDYFTVLRSKDAVSFELIGEMDGAGNSNVQLDYTFYDESPLPGVSYYQLKQTDFNGKSSFSDIVSVKRELDLSVEIYPNPATNLFNVKGVSEGVELKIFNSFGALVFHKLLIRSGESVSLNQISAGIYVVNIIENDGRLTIKKLVVKD